MFQYFFNVSLFAIICYYLLLFVFTFFVLIGHPLNRPQVHGKDISERMIADTEGFGASDAGRNGTPCAL